MRHSLRTLSLILVVCLGSGGATAADWWEEPTAASAVDLRGQQASASGILSQAWRLDWAGGSIQVMAGATADPREVINSAHARSIAVKTARHLAYERLAEVVSGIRIDADATYDRELMLDANLRTRVSSLVRGAQVVEERVTSDADGSIWAEVILELSLHGGPTALAGPTTEWVLEKGKVERRATAPSLGGAAVAGGAEPAFTGIVLDASGLGGAPAMLPRILDPEGRVVYGAGDVPSDYLVRHGLMGYAPSVAVAREGERTGESPLVIRVLRMDGPDAVVSSEDAARLLAENARSRLLDKCRVTLVLDGEEVE